MEQTIIDKARHSMADDGLDILVAASPENFAYLAGFMIPSQPLLRWRHAFFVLTADGRKSALVVDMEENTARDHLSVETVMSYNEFTGEPMAALAELLRLVGASAARIGVETDYIPHKDMLALQKILPRASFHACQAVFERLRMVKTERELAILEKISKITDKSICEALRSVEAGRTELELAGLGVRNIFVGGAESYKLLIVASGERSGYPNVGPTDRRLARGDLVRFEMFGLLSNYHAGVCRTAVVGQPNPRQAAIWQNLVECKYMVLEMMKPGADGAEIYKKFLAKFEQFGLKPINFVGHGVGLSLHEAPYIGRYRNAILEPGMVFGIEPLVFEPGNGYQLKDVVAVTDRGSKLLSDYTSTDTLISIQA